MYRRFVAACLLVSLSCSCTWRQVGCASGAALAYAGTSALLDQDEKNRIEKGKKTLSKEEKALIIGSATALGCMIGSEIAGGIEVYVAKKREEYKNEAAFLEAHIAGLKQSVRKADQELAWLDQQALQLQEEAQKIRQLPALRQEMAARLKTAAEKRKSDAGKLQTYLKDARADARKAYASSSDAKLKGELKKKIAELDERLVRTRQVTNNILAAGSRVAYL